MLKRKQTRAIQKFIYSVFKQFWQLSRSASRKLSRWLVRNLVNGSRRQRLYGTSKAGFVLPTVTLLLIVVSLVIAAILFRTSSRTQQVIGAREEQIIYNAATPAIERAKAKLEYLFLRDKRFPSGPPSDEMLMSMLTNNPTMYSPPLTYQLNPDPYTLADERQDALPGRLDLDGNGPDPAWAYKIDVDGDGTKETVVYSITLKRRANNGITLENSNDRQKATNLVVRNGPINTIGSTNSVCSTLTQPPPPANNATLIRATNEADWFPVGSAVLRKTFQVDAIVVSSKSGTSRTVATLEFQQDRQLDRGNKWGAWFRYDMEIFPGFNFRWNGAMYTAGNLMVGGGANFTSYLISSRNSCFYTRDASEITVNQNILPTENPQNPNFQGQIIAGQLDSSSFNGSSSFHVMNPDNSPNTNTTDTVLNNTTDSLNQDYNPIINIALDPVILLTENKSRSRVSTFNNSTLTDSRREPKFDLTNASAGQPGYFNTTKRIFNRSETPPFIDDTYRADDRYGPKPSYGRNREVELDASSKKNGVKITDAADRQLLSNNTVDALDTEFRNLGWDGYWERRATLAGLRLMVGERLVLGNPYGWTNNDPLYPPNASGLTNQARQRRTLRDNLAAVQATAVYHVANPNGGGNVPIACIATTAHPGTQGTIDLSKDFRTTNGQLSTNFFTGKGTNGWEYNTPPSGLGGNWDNALNNLARFAGELDGAFPPKQESGKIHPNPFLTMWGNFSNLRRAMEDTNNSIADSTYKYTAACTMGILAKNIVDISDRAKIIATANPWSDWDTALSGSPATTLTANSAPDEYIKSVSSDATQRENARLIALWQQIERDRNFGFAPVPSPIASATAPYDKYQYKVQYLTSAVTAPAPSTAYTFAGVTYDANPSVTESATVKRNLALSCNYKDPVANGGLNYFGLGDPSTWSTTDRETKEKQFIRLAVTLCPSGQPKFPSLYYLFPTQARSDRNSIQTAINTSEPYIQQTNAAGIPAGGFAQLNPSDIALEPRLIGDWRLPRTTDGSGRSVQTRITKPDNGQEYVSLIDTTLYNSREMMTVRTLDIDLDLLRRNNVPGASDTWLPASGIVYAFREDAVREDAISRPVGAGASWGSCDSDSKLRTSSSCQMNVNTPQDPPVSDRGISTKPVDYYPDPDRRPHGFRLRKGQNISRGASNPRGLSFVSDQPIYIQGDFNYHSTDGNSNNLEEFTQTLNANWDNFYSRLTLDTNFARPATDTWRPSEILADSVTILSNNFTEGTIELGITNSGGSHSFRAMNGPNNSRTWVREDATTSNSALPIKVSRNGSPIYCSTTPTAGQLCPTANLVEENSYRTLDTNYWNSINSASATRVNATIISGILPSRQNQSYGGFQNFPRFIENWGGNNGTTMAISGSFIQLNFSTYGTGPFLQNDAAWEPSTSDPTFNVTYPQYYLAPGRQWGYDVGLQYAPAGPVAQRFVLPPASRSEFYRDLKADDPYICTLRLALNRIDNRLDPASQTECN